MSTWQILIYCIGIPFIGVPLANLTLHLVKLGEDIFERPWLVFIRDSLHPISFWWLWNRQKGNYLSDYEGMLMEALFWFDDDLDKSGKRAVFITLSAIYWPVKVALLCFGIVVAVIEKFLCFLFFRNQDDED